MVPGPDAATTALVLSGLPSDRFVFEGFLPRKGRSRADRIAAIAAEPRTVVLYESPRRVLATLRDLEAACGPDRPVALARELTKLHEEIRRGSIAAVRAALGDDEPRGECVIVLGGATVDETPATDDEVDAALTRGARGGGVDPGRGRRGERAAAGRAARRLRARGHAEGALSFSTHDAADELLRELAQRLGRSAEHAVLLHLLEHDAVALGRHHHEIADVDAQRLAHLDGKHDAPELIDLAGDAVRHVHDPPNERSDPPGPSVL